MIAASAAMDVQADRKIARAGRERDRNRTSKDIDGIKPCSCFVDVPTAPASFGKAANSGLFVAIPTAGRQAHSAAYRPGNFEGF